MGKSLKSKSFLKAINDIVFIEEDPLETVYDTGVSSDVTNALKSGLLILPDSHKDFAQKYPCRGTVVAKGDKCKEVNVGDRIIYPRLGVQRFQFDNKIYCSVREDDIHGFIESC